MLFLYALRFFFVTLNLIVNLILRYAGAQPIAISGYLQAPMATLECLLYPLMGYFLAEKLPMEKVQRKHLVASVIILISGCILAAVTTYAEHLRFDATQNYIGLSNYTSAAVVFFLVRYFCEKHTFSAKWAHRLQTISSLTVGIYLLEPVVHLLHGPFFEHIYWHPVLITLFSIVWAVLCMAIGGTATWLLRKNSRRKDCSVTIRMPGKRYEMQEYSALLRETTADIGMDRHRIAAYACRNPGFQFGFS